VITILAFVFIVGLVGLAWIILRESQKARSPVATQEFDPELLEPGEAGAVAPAGPSRIARSFGHREVAESDVPPEVTERVEVPGFDTPLDDSLTQYRAGRKSEALVDQPVRVEPIPPTTETPEPAPVDAPVLDPVVEPPISAINDESDVAKPLRRRTAPKAAIAVEDGAAPPKPVRRPRVKKEV
jgi:hypothetical protein